MIALKEYCNEPVIILDKNENIIVIVMPIQSHDWKFDYEFFISNSDEKLEKHGLFKGYKYTYVIYPTLQVEDGVYCFPLQDYNEEDKKLIKRLAKQINLSKCTFDNLYKEEKEKMIKWFEKNLLTD